MVHNYMMKNMSINHNMMFGISGLVFTVLVIGFYAVSKVGNCSDSSEGFWDVGPFAKCKGTEYMWQGDSDEAKFCRALADTPEGRCGISSYNCPKGFVGQPSLPFYYTPISDDSWKNERCDNAPTCPCKDVGLCSMEAQV